MTRKDYILIASIIQDAEINRHESTPRITFYFLAHNFADMLARDNPHFNRAKFLKACGVQS